MNKNKKMKLLRRSIIIGLCAIASIISLKQSEKEVGKERKEEKIYNHETLLKSYVAIKDFYNLEKTNIADINVKPIELSENISKEYLLELINNEYIKLDINLSKKYFDYEHVISESDEKTNYYGAFDNITAEMLVNKIISNNNNYETDDTLTSFFKKSEKNEEILIEIIDELLESDFIDDSDILKLSDLKILVSTYYRENDYSAFYTSEENVILLDKEYCFDWTDVEKIEKKTLIHELGHVLESNEVNILPSFLQEATVNTNAYYILGDDYYEMNTYLYESYLENAFLVLGLSNRVDITKYFETIFKNDIKAYYEILGYNTTEEKHILGDYLVNLDYLALTRDDIYTESEIYKYSDEEKELIEIYTLYDLYLKAIENTINTLDKSTSYEENVSILNQINNLFFKNDLIRYSIDKNVIQLFHNYKAIYEFTHKYLEIYYGKENGARYSVITNDYSNLYGYKKITFSLYSEISLSNFSKDYVRKLD